MQCRHLPIHFLIRGEFRGETQANIGAKHTIIYVSKNVKECSIPDVYIIHCQIPKGPKTLKTPLQYFAFLFETIHNGKINELENHL